VVVIHRGRRAGRGGTRVQPSGWPPLNGGHSLLHSEYHRVRALARSAQQVPDRLLIDILPVGGTLFDRPQ
jgi:hypothetical protein